MDYTSSGVNIDAGNETVRRIKEFARRTFVPGVLSGIGSFGGLFQLGGRWRDPVLVASADGVGTKLKVAFLAHRHDTVGTDLVNHCVNDILVQGATPLFFLDYLATGRLSPDVAVDVIKGVARGCEANGCALLGGETAEMPGFYAEGEYDLAGFIVGVVEREHVITGAAIVPGDVLIGLPSTGLHTNGYSLARRIVFERQHLGIDDRIPGLARTVKDVLLEGHRSYLDAVRPLLGPRLLKGMAHITGGGITENLPRILPETTAALVDRTRWQVPAVFRWLQEAGDINVDEMYRVFNMGLGLILVCAPADAPTAVELLGHAGEQPVEIGRVIDGERRVIYDTSGVR